MISFQFSLRTWFNLGVEHLMWAERAQTEQIKYGAIRQFSKIPAQFHSLPSTK